MSNATGRSIIATAALLAGFVSYSLDKIKISLGPMVLALVLGCLIEQSFRQGMTISNGNPQIFSHSTLAVILSAICMVLIGLIFTGRLFARRPNLSGARPSAAQGAGYRLQDMACGRASAEIA